MARQSPLRHARRIAWLAVVVVAGTGCGGDGEAASAGKTFETPQAAFDAFRSATQDNDWATAAHVLVPESQAIVAVPMVMEASFMTGGEPKKEQSLDAILKKHGIDLDAEPPPESAEPTSPDEMMQAMIAPVSDVPAFLGELSTWIEKNGDPEDRKGGFMSVGELSKVSVDGDRATATVSMEMGEMPISFRRTDGSWRIQLPTEGPRARAQSQAAAQQVHDPNRPEIGTIWIGENEYKLRHAIAYPSKFFDDPCTVVLLTAQPIPDRELDGLKKMLATEGHDEAFHVWDSQVKLTFDASGELMFVNAWADNVSLGSSGDDVAAQMEQHNGRVTGNAVMPEPEETLDSTYHFEATFDAELIGADQQRSG